MINLNELQMISTVLQRLNTLSESLGPDYSLSGLPNGNLLVEDEGGMVFQLEYIDIEWQIVNMRKSSPNIY